MHTGFLVFQEEAFSILTLTMDHLTSIYDEIAEVAGLLHSKGWAEKNAGNFSVRIDTEMEGGSEEIHTLTGEYPLLANAILVVSGKGKRMRDIAKSPAENTVVIWINEKGSGYCFLSVSRIEPTSELPTHLAIHSMIAGRGSMERAVLHSHVTELIAISHLPEFCDQDKLNNLIWKMHPEALMFIPDGIGFVPFEIPGTEEIAQATLKALEDHSIALWEKHGVFSIAPTLGDGFDMLDITAKSIRIYFMCLQAGKVPPGLSDVEMRKIREDLSIYRISHI